MKEECKERARVSRIDREQELLRERADVINLVREVRNANDETIREGYTDRLNLLLHEQGALELQTAEMERYIAAMIAMKKYLDEDEGDTSVLAETISATRAKHSVIKQRLRDLQIRRELRETKERVRIVEDILSTWKNLGDACENDKHFIEDDKVWDAYAKSPYRATEVEVDER